MRVHHIVLLALAAPIIGVGVVVWFLLPGSVAGLTFTPSQFDQDATLRPTYWFAHDVTLRGFVRALPCSGRVCSRELVLSDSPDDATEQGIPPDPLRDVVLLPQGESGWHSFLRGMLPHLVSRPIGTADEGQRVTVTGRLLSGFSPGIVPRVRPNSL